MPGPSSLQTLAVAMLPQLAQSWRDQPSRGHQPGRMQHLHPAREDATMIFPLFSLLALHVGVSGYSASSLTVAIKAASSTGGSSVVAGSSVGSSVEAISSVGSSAVASSSVGSSLGVSSSVGSSAFCEMGGLQTIVPGQPLAPQ